VAGELYGGRRSCSGHRKKRKKRCRCDFGLLKSYFVALYCFCCCCFCSGRRFLSFPASSDGLRRASSDCSVLFFNVLLLFLGTSSLFCVFLASFEAPLKFCIFQRCSGEVFFFLLLLLPVSNFQRNLLVNHMKYSCCW
jgi:hypothetical protein